MKERSYIAIDLKAFYASVECTERGLDPLRTNLVVADESRTDKTICLAITPPLKSYGMGGRGRLFEVRRLAERVNRERKRKIGGKDFAGSSSDAEELAAHPEYALDFIIAKPRMRYYMEYSRKILSIYMRYVSAEDMHVYSIDEVFIDLTPYLAVYGMSAEEMARKMIREVLAETGITATCGVGTNLYLAKIAMDITAKHMQPDEHGVRLASLTERSFREQLWDHRPLTDFWRIGKGTARRLASCGIETMGDIARASLGAKDAFLNEDLLFKLFGVNAELLIDHAWGYEPCTIADIKSYIPEDRSLSSGQVLPEPYPFEAGALIVREMADLLSLELVEKGYVTRQLSLYVGYDADNLTDPKTANEYRGKVKNDWYGRAVPEGVHGQENFDVPTASGKRFVEAAYAIYRRIVDPALTIRRVVIAAGRLIRAEEAEDASFGQMDLFTDYRRAEEERAAMKKETQMQKAAVELQKRFGKNAVVKGMNLLPGGKTIERNGQVGGHKA